MTVLNGRAPREPADDATPVVESRRRFRLPTAWRTPLTVVGGVIVILWLLVALFGPLISPADPLAQSPDRLMPPSAAHLLGTDTLGRDVLSRIIAGSRAIVATRSARVTTPTTRPSRRIGMTVIPRFTMVSASSGNVVCSSAVTTLRNITSAAVWASWLM